VAAVVCAGRSGRLSSHIGALRGKATVYQRFFDPLPDDVLRAWE
jgi:hypothetical protein